MSSDQFDLFGAKSARDAAFSQIAEHNKDWRWAALVGISQLYPMEGTAEDIRITLLEKGLSSPNHHNAWGELTKSAIKKGLLTRTGELRHMRTKKSHARLTPVYRINAK